MSFRLSAPEKCCGIHHVLVRAILATAEEQAHCWEEVAADMIETAVQELLLVSQEAKAGDVLLALLPLHHLVRVERLKTRLQGRRDQRRHLSQMMAEMQDRQELHRTAPVQNAAKLLQQRDAPVLHSLPSTQLLIRQC
jgi:hypothetical protein